MKNGIKYLFILFLFITFSMINVKAEDNNIYINIEKNQISTDHTNYNDIKKYDSLDHFLIDYKNNNLPDIYLTTFLFDGVSSVKSPDLDDFIEDNSNQAKIKTLEIEVLNINTTGYIELTGSKKGMMIAVNTNELKGNINIILNNVHIDTDTKKAPVIYVYNKDMTYTDAKVVITPKDGTKNYLEGGKFKKVSLMPSDELDRYKSYYNGDALTNYNNYSSYYGIYTKEELNNILFATVKTDNDGLKDGDPYCFYKGSGAISSDIDLYFEGNGYLSVTSKNKEGIETKGNLIFSGGIGDYEISAYDDCLNTTTSNSMENTVRNNIIIDVNTLIAIVNDDGDEGDAIDSNGTLTINGGTIFAFAHSRSGDAGLDSENGTIINGGTIIATGNMTDRISNESKQKYIYVNFNSKIEKDTLIVIKDQNNKIITAFKTGKDIMTLFYSDNTLDFDSFKIYSDGIIDGEEKNGLYTKINSYKDGNLITYNEVSSFNNPKETKTNQNNFILKLLIGETISLIILLIYIISDYYITNRKQKTPSKQ